MAFGFGSSSVIRAARSLAVAAAASWALAAGAASGLTPQPGDFKTILNSKSSALAVWRLAENPEVLVFDFPSMAQQGRAFNRITQLTEQFNEPYKRVLSGEEFQKYLASLRRSESTFAYGHDVLVSELVLFYNLADRDKIELTAEEQMLREFLVEQGLIRSWRGITQAMKPDVVIIAVPQTREKGGGEPQINDLARRAILTHEISHGEFYANPYYANYCRKFWAETLTDNQRAIFTKFLSKYNYAVNQDELLVNEMQAYLIFTPDPNAFSADKLGITETELESIRRSFRQGRPPTKLPLVH